MPKIVDHGERRAQLVAACLRVVSREGLAGTTTREIAKEAGVSHGIIAHYFDGKDAILRAALQQSYEQLATRIIRAVDGLSGGTALRAAVLESLPADAESLSGEQIELAFWSFSLGNPTLAKERWQSYSDWRRLLEHLVREARAQGEIPLTHEPALIAEALIALIDGLGAQAVLYPDKLDHARQVAVVDSVLTSYGVILPQPAR
jgi:Transcriptional regulator